MTKRVETNLMLSYDDVLIKPRYSEVLPSQAKLSGQFSRNIPLNIPLASAAMDTVTESQTAIVMAQNGGIGVIHKNMDPEEQAAHVSKVKRYETGVVLHPVTIGPNETLRTVQNLTKNNKITGLPVVDTEGTLIGIITNRDMRFEANLNLSVYEVMTPREKLITGHEGIDLQAAKELMHKNKIEKLPIIDSNNKLKGLITIKDIKKSIAYPLANKDKNGSLRVAAAVGVGNREYKRAELLAKASVDAIVIDTAHGDSKGVIEMIKGLKSTFPQLEIVAGNIATKEAAERLIKAGVDGIKVGIGPGSICTTRVIAGIGVPQLSALLDCASVCMKHKIPFIADGGIRFSGDVVKALAAGSSCIMIGSLFAGTDEAPGELILYQGRSYKSYRGMGSLGAMVHGSKDRYGQAEVEEVSKLVPEGIEGQVPYKGPLTQTLFQLLGGIRSAMGYVGAIDIPALYENAEFIQITNQSHTEGHPHDIIITKEAPNYQLRSSY